MGRGVPIPSRLRGLGERRKRNEFWCILELEKTHLIDTNLSFFTFLGDLGGWIEMPGGPDCGPSAVCWTLLVYSIGTHTHVHVAVLQEPVLYCLLNDMI